MGPNQVRASHILVSTEAEAKELLEKIQGGENFVNLAQGRSKCPSGKKGGDLGFFKRQQMVREFEKFCFTHKPGEIGIIKTEFGWHVLKVTDAKKK
ncbi:MAG: peptidylprolyl isomerase [Candidatus Altiarchaeota archaeon]|nr:peptidylprolyl isomerase [Candidatus Altiarchaeota archaeon]